MQLPTLINLRLSFIFYLQPISLLQTSPINRYKIYRGSALSLTKVHPLLKCVFRAPSHCLAEAPSIGLLERFNGNSLISIGSYRGIYNDITDLFSIRMYFDGFIGLRIYFKFGKFIMK